MKKQSIFLIFLILLILNIQLSLAYFSVNILNYDKEKATPYEGQYNKITGSFRVDKDNWEIGPCLYDCKIQLGSGFQQINRVNPGINTLFNLDNVVMEGNNHEFKKILVVSCERTSGVSILCENKIITDLGKDKYNDSREIPIPLRNSQDSTCDYQDGENCKNNNACMLCQPPQYTCIPDSPRQKDDYGCTTWCGNGFIETQYESCSTCPQDVGKCDGSPCAGNSDCQKNHYCVWNVCSDKSYRIGDGHCDITYLENCLNSPTDCACQKNMKCNNQKAICEFYCGNGICEESEKGICKADCKWCGDGECSGADNCKNCPEDCGKCKEDVQPIVETVSESTANEQNNVPSYNQPEQTQTQQEQYQSYSSPVAGNVINNSSILKDKNKLLTLIGIIIIVIIILLCGIYFFRKRKIEHKENKQNETN